MRLFKSKEDKEWDKLLKHHATLEVKSKELEVELASLHLMIDQREEELQNQLHKRRWYKQYEV
jgi:hypothetical protein